MIEFKFNICRGLLSQLEKIIKHDYISNTEKWTQGLSKEIRHPKYKRIHKKHKVELMLKVRCEICRYEKR